MNRTLLPGRPYPLGATVTSKGTNFAIFSEGATRVELCFFDAEGRQVDSVYLRERTAYVWHGLVRNIKAGQLYGYRIDGPWEPEKGHRFNAHKLLIDPYAKALSGEVDWQKPIFGHDVASGDDLKMDENDSADGVPKSVVVDSQFDWGDDCCPETPLADSVIYEMHVKGFSILNPGVPEELRGTYAGLACATSIDYLKKLGVTAVELMPIHHFIDERRLVGDGLVNYWGYNTLGYFAPMARYSSCEDIGGQVNEFKRMVKALHAAGIEVILDVVYNHTCEGNELGPTLCWRGVCNTTYYRVKEDNPRYYIDYTGTGNTLNVRLPQVLKMLMDSLRYWVTEMHVDGFRFDLAATLARELHDVSRLSSFFDTIHQDPTLADVKLIAEPWDVGEGGYQVGQFPVLWAEWNGKYRDTVRRFWKGDGGQLSALANRLTGSSDLYQDDGRKPYASINFVTAHDGFTLCDLVSYNQKHNEANGEDNRDGSDSNDSWNMGAEGPTDDAKINVLRERQTRNFLTTLMLSQGVPMLSGGDEIARSQRGNNNCYCQDNELTWHDWNLDEPRKRVLDFTSQLIHFRLAHPNLHRRKFFQDREIRRKGEDIVIKDVAWFSTDGKQVSDEAWNTEWNRSVAVLLNGRTLQVSDEDGRRVMDDSFFLVVNAAEGGVEYVLPVSPSGKPWCEVIDTENIDNPFACTEVDGKIIVGGRALKLLSDGAVSSINGSSAPASSVSSAPALPPKQGPALV
ncbi:glycogen debranching protein GlgX [Tunturibacter psychrotolerans]|uniref:Glycogen debranching protein GlgX n=1 Tax=Tunturiibacter psychrotolerans TaxID=3069686 RepID=A0AAU7ZWW9_9BACT